jgi:4'-phosphopantetheinyl transferase
MTVAALENSIHVWTLPSNDSTSAAGKEQHDQWLELLSTDELERAGRFHFAHHAAEYVANRGRLRCLLGQYLNVDAGQLKFHYNPQGKPGLGPAYGDIYFNLSHTDGLALLAMTRGRRVGIDVERFKAATDTLDLARQYFSLSEVKAIESYANPAEQQAAFFRCWTRKEAFLKALGDGLSRPLAEFSASCVSDKPELLDCAWDTNAHRVWQFISLEPGPGYTAALVCERSSALSPVLKTYTWSQE